MIKSEDISVKSPQSLPEMVYRELRGAIMSGLFVPGQTLRQEDVAKRLGVSRAPLREALPRLEAEGMVTLNPRHGYSVVSLQPEEIQEIFRLRAVVESEAISVAAKLRTREDIDHVRALAKKIPVNFQKSDPTSVSNWFEAHAKFHDAMLAPSHYRHFLRQVDSLRAIVEPYIRIEILLTGDLHEARSEHKALLTAFEEGDAAVLSKITSDHCEHTAARLLTGLKKREEAVKAKESADAVQSERSIRRREVRKL